MKTIYQVNGNTYYREAYLTPLQRLSGQREYHVLPFAPKNICAAVYHATKLFPASLVIKRSWPIDHK